MPVLDELRAVERQVSRRCTVQSHKNFRAGEWLVYRHYQVEGAGESAYLWAPIWWTDAPDDPKELELYRGYKSSLDKQYEDNPEFAAYLAAQGMGIDHKNKPERYVPLDYHDLFLLCAKLVEEGPITLEVVRDWRNSMGCWVYKEPA